jgi:hypothetical protein
MITLKGNLSMYSHGTFNSGNTLSKSIDDDDKMNDLFSIFLPHPRHEMERSLPCCLALTLFSHHFYVGVDCLELYFIGSTVMPEHVIH